MNAETTPSGSRDPLHGITLEQIVNHLVHRHGWSEMGQRIPIRCFQFHPSVKSSLTFLRKTLWARRRVEDWFISELDTSASTEVNGGGKAENRMEDCPPPKPCPARIEKTIGGDALMRRH